MRVVLSQSIKGGCGKTLIAVNMAHKLAKDYRVALVDCDVDSPNVGGMISIKNKIQQDENRYFIPAKWEMEGRLPVEVVSAGMFDEGLVTLFKTGEEVRQILYDLIQRSRWSSPDYMICDLPAGSGDELRAVMETLGRYLVGTVLVTLPTTLEDCMRVVDLCSRFGVRILGIIVNQDGAICECGGHPICPECEKPFNPLGTVDEMPEITAEGLANKFNIPLLGKIPIMMGFSQQVAQGNPIIPEHSEGPINMAIEEIKKYRPGE